MRLREYSLNEAVLNAEREAFFSGVGGIPDEERLAAE